jgi:F420H(2)-dependent quinone reductase
MAENWNSAIIEEFRANRGKVGGYFDGAPLLLLHTTGAKSGQERVKPGDVSRRRWPARGLRVEGRR